MKAIVYARVSTDKQELSIPDQVSRCLRYCDAHDIQAVGIMKDGGVSASKPFLVRFDHSTIELTEYGKLPTADFDCIVALSHDRMFRSVADFLATLEYFDETGVAIHFVDGGELATGEPDQWFIQIQKAVFAEFERRKGSQRTRRALQQVVAEGRKIGEAPYGWQNVGGGKHAPNPNEQVVIAKILDLAATDVSNRAIAGYLTSNNIFTRDGKHWSHVQVGRVLQRAEAGDSSE